MRAMTARTMYGAVDLAPLLRRLDGETTAPLPDWERPAAIAALTDMGLPTGDVARVLNMGFALTAETMREYRTVRDAHRDVERVVTERALQIARWRAETRERLRVKNRHARAGRLAKRIEVDGLWFHPDAPHGTNTGYNAYGCRCEGCRGAHSRVQRERRAAA